MARQRRGSNVSSTTSTSIPERNDQVCDRLCDLDLMHFSNMLSSSQELGSMYDYLAKIILLGPSGSGKFVDSPSLQQIPGLILAPGPASCTALSRMNVGLCWISP